MKRISLPAAFLFLSASMAFATVTKDDVRKLLAAGISEDTIILYIHRNAPAPSPSPEDVVELKNAGASDSHAKRASATRSGRTRRLSHRRSASS